MREKEEEDNTQQKVPLLYTILTTHMCTHTHTTHLCTHTHATHMRTHMDFSHATKPRTDTPSKAGVFQNQVLFQPMNVPMLRPMCRLRQVSQTEVASQLMNHLNAGIQQPTQTFHTQRPKPSRGREPKKQNFPNVKTQTFQLRRLAV